MSNGEFNYTANANHTYDAIVMKLGDQRRLGCKRIV